MQKANRFIIVALVAIFVLEILLGVVSIVSLVRIRHLEKLKSENYWSKLGMLVLNDDKVLNVPVIMYDKNPGRYEVIPVLAFMQEIGFEVTWIDETHAHITGYGNVYDLDMNAELPGMALVQRHEDSEDEGLLFALPGSSVYTCIPTGKDYLIDSGTLRNILWRAGLSPKISSDFENGILYVSVIYP